MSKTRTSFNTSTHQDDTIPPQSLIITDINSPHFAHSIYEAAENLPDVPYDLVQFESSNPVKTPDEYPQAPNPRLLQPEFFSRFDLSTLFYIFFYFPGKPQQFFAGRELQQREWKFHPKYQTWFHRIGSPIEVSPHYEIGNFLYFDHTTSQGWCVRQREHFKFDYDFLEPDLYV